MLGSPRTFFFALIILAVGVSLSLSRTPSDTSKVKSVEDYWAETGLGPVALEDLLQDQTCSSSERYFLACANSILTISNRFNIGLSKDGNLVPAHQALSHDMTSEKGQLEPWREFFEKENAKAMEISFLKAWRDLESHYVKDSQKALMVGLGLNGFISVFRDPHTYFMPVSQFEEVVSKADNRSTSLGITLGQSLGRYMVRKVMNGSPASLEGIKKGDVLVAINDQKTLGLTQARVSELLRGEVGDVTSLALERDGKMIKRKLRRLEMTVATVSTQVIDGIKSVGVIGINKFAKGACEKVKESLRLVKNAHVRGLLLDLRDNPGGQLEEAACVTSLFVGADKKIFEVRYLDPAKKAEQYLSEEEQLFDLPMAVLINASSASAAEIVAGALRDLNRAVLVGEKTFGKGSFQEGEYWSQNKKIALFETKGFYYLPSGRSPQMRGLVPDVAVDFDGIYVGREADQFMNPLRAPERRMAKVVRPFASADCLETEDNHTSEDAQLAKARQVLFCSKGVAGAEL